jgi:hypothetical protein
LDKKAFQWTKNEMKSELHEQRLGKSDDGEFHVGSKVS